MKSQSKAELKVNLIKEIKQSVLSYGVLSQQISDLEARQESILEIATTNFRLLKEIDNSVQYVNAGGYKIAYSKKARGQVDMDKFMQQTTKEQREIIYENVTITKTAMQKALGESIINKIIVYKNPARISITKFKR